MEDYQPGKRHPSIQYVNGMRDALRVSTKVKLLTGTYILQSNRSTFNQNELSPLCLLCREDDETIEHFLLHCPVLDSVRRVLLNDLVNIYENLYHEQPDASRLLQFILDCGLVMSDDTEQLSQLRPSIEFMSETTCCTFPKTFPGTAKKKKEKEAIEKYKDGRGTTRQRCFKLYIF